MNKEPSGAPAWSQPLPLDCVISTEELTRRPVRDPDLAAENRVLLQLADTMARAPDQLLQALVDRLLELCRAGSSGISLLEQSEVNAEPCFRWIATAGHFQQYAGHTMPRSASPCGRVIDSDCMLLMSRPARQFPTIQTLPVPVEEVLLFPFHRDGTPVGTIWVASHSKDRSFDREDVRVIQDLAQFAAAAIRLRTEARESLVTLSHELRNAVAPLANAMTLLQSSSDTEVLRRARQITDRQMQQLRRLIEDVLESSRMSSHKMRLETTPVDLTAVVSQAVELATERIVQSGQRVELSLSEESLIVEGDSQRLSQVFTNLLNNAVKYGKAGSTVTIDAHREDHRAVVSVADQGIGIGREMLPRIFDLFFQTDASVKQSQGGLGIGLALVKQLTELHGGQVRARSDGPGRGSQFSVYLPLHGEYENNSVAMKGGAPGVNQTVS